MKNIAKVLILLLALCMIVPCFAACNDNKPTHQTPPPSESGDVTTPGEGGNIGGGDNSTTPEEVIDVTTPPEETVILPEKVDLGGYIYKAYVRDLAGTYPSAYEAQLAYGNNDYRCIDFWVSEGESATDAITYAVYSRNKQIENDFNCKIKQVSSDGDQIAHLLAAYTNGDGYDLTIIMARSAAQAATQNLLRNLKDNQNLDLTHASFDQNSINELSVGNKLYFVSGDMNISTMDVAGLSIVNMEFYANIVDTIIEEFEGNTAFGNIYNIVLSNKWTMDTMLKIATLANVDAGQDGGGLHVLPNGTNGGTLVPDRYPGGDVVGYHQYLYSALWYFYGSGGRITIKNDDGLPEFVIQSSTGQTLYDYIFDKFNRKVGENTWIPHEASSILNMNYLTGDVLFADCSLFNVRNEIYPKAEFEYGILPIPVYEEGMPYKSVVYFNNWAHLWAIPSLVNREEESFLMMQIMAAYSSLEDSTMHAYYDRTVYLQAAADNGSRKAMDIIRTSMVYDIALLYAAKDWGNIETNLIQIPNEETSKFSGMAESINSGRLEDVLLSTIEMLLNPEDAFN